MLYYIRPFSWTLVNQYKDMKQVLFQKLVLLLLLAMVVPSAYAQTQVYYSYDACGNRVSRTTTVAKTRAVDGDESSQTIDKGKLGNVRTSLHQTEDRLIVEIPGWSTNDEGLLSIYDMNGRCVTKSPVVNSVTEIDLSPYTVGCYILQLLVNRNKESWKIIRE